MQVPYSLCSQVKDFASKSPEQAARIAGVLHVFESGPGGTISEDTMRRAVRLAAWHLHEAGRMFTTSGLPQAFRDAVQLLEWLSGQFQVSQESQQSQRSILQHGPNPVRDKDRRDAALRVLEDHGWVRLRSEGRQRLGDLHPRLRA